ncbi:MAG: hypothetical protein QNJ46_26975 [Leptolyngbyaceae cyanobacterium MO_188.B28]|nr:hypothetical protein [Leptolyngbyaceae cyanobacterium MO_188.B28]
MTLNYIREAYQASKSLAYAIRTRNSSKLQDCLSRLCQHDLMFTTQVLTQTGFRMEDWWQTQKLTEIGTWLNGGQDSETPPWVF